MVFVFIPQSTHSSTETFTIEGGTVQRDYDWWVNQNDWSHERTTGPVRWLWLGQHFTDGILNISWTLSNSVERVFLRELPTPAEAFGWHATTGADTEPPALAVPDGLNVTGQTASQIDLAWSACTDNVAVDLYRIFQCQGVGCTPTVQLTTVSHPTLTVSKNFCKND